jgi:methylmalonyl-CoA mutase N-terminal domain/subunit
VVGVNKFRVQEVNRLGLLRVDPAIEQAQRIELAALREKRDRDRVMELLGQLDAAARRPDSENLLPLLIACVEADVTLGEICGALREVWGEYRPTMLI